MVASVMAGLLALIGALFGLGLGLGALMLVLLPLFALALIPLVPVLLAVALLRRFGVARSRGQGLIAVLLGLLLLAAAVQLSWGDRLTAWRDWLDDNRAQLALCRAHGLGVTILRDADGIHLSCGLGRARRRPSSPPEDANI